MRTLVVFYSLTGNVRFIADIMAQSLGATLQPLTLVEAMPQSTWKSLWKGGGQVIRKATPALEPLQHHPDDFDQLVIGTPIWAATFAPAIRTFLAQYPLREKRLAFYCCHGGGGKGRAFKRLRTILAGNVFIGEYECKEPLKQDREEVEQSVRQWAQTLIAHT